MILGGSLLLALRWYIMGASTPVFQQVDNPASFAENLLVRVSKYVTNILQIVISNIKYIMFIFHSNLKLILYYHPY